MACSTEVSGEDRHAQRLCELGQGVSRALLWQENSNVKGGGTAPHFSI